MRLAARAASRGRSGDAVAGAAPVSGTNRRRGRRRAFRSRRVRLALRAAQSRGHGADHPLAAPAARLRRVSHLPALGHSYRPVHARRGDSQVRRHRQCAKGRDGRAHGRLRHLRSQYAGAPWWTRSRGLRAPFGVYGSLGNHDAWAGVEDSITELFRQTGVRILRGANVPIAAGGESFNLIGVDFQSPRRFGPSPPVKHLLGNIEGLIDRHRVNILLSHNPDTFDRAAELGIDLSLAGHTHGGQAALEFISPEIAPSRLVTPYVAGWFEQAGRSTVRQPRHRHHFRSDSHRRAAGDHGLLAGACLKASLTGEPRRRETRRKNAEKTLLPILLRAPSPLTQRLRGERVSLPANPCYHRT